MKFEFERATKRTYRYRETTEPFTVLGTVYIQKWAIGNEPVKEIEIRVYVNGEDIDEVLKQHIPVK